MQTLQQLQNQLIQPEFTWVTFMNNNFGQEWIKLTDQNGNPIFWNESQTHIIKQIVKLKFPETSFGISPCNQKNIDNICIDNL